jgi:hypothetical protein
VNSSKWHHSTTFSFWLVSTEWLGRKRTIEITGGARLQILQIGAANGDETLEASTRAHGNETMTVEALVETVPGADLRAVHLRENLLEGTKTEPAGNAENALQTVQTRIAEETDTAATDIATIVTVTVIANDHREDTAAHDLGLAPHADHKLLRELYNGAALCHHNPTPLRANWCSPAMHLPPRRSSPISTRLEDLQLKVIQFRSKGVKGLS